MELAAHLRELCGQVREACARLSESDWRESRGAGKWTRLEIAGHLIDSAANNHLRIVMAVIEGSYTGPTYKQEEDVAVQGWAEAPVAEVIGLLVGYNLHLSRVIARIPEERWAASCAIGHYAPMMLRELVEDYVAHLAHHLRQVFEGRVELRYSELPWPPPGTRWQ